MSQPNYPSFSFHGSSDDCFFNTQQSQPSATASFSQWTSQDSRALRNAGPRPPSTYRSSRSVSNTRPTTLVNFAPPNVPLPDSRIDPGLSLLSVPPISRPRSALGNLSDANPITRFYNEDAPWSSERMRNPGGSIGRSAFSQPNMEYGTYREPPTSEIESIAPKSDSGYHSHQTGSIMSIDPEQCNREMPPEMTFRLGNVTVNSEPTEVYRLENAERASQYSGRSSKEFKCPYCKEISKCNSDYKKHMLRHDKPFVCDVQNCRRDGKGFTTVNDLNRHKKSVHRIGALDNSYQCASESCRNREKIWPRLDNFKQHVHRMHPVEDEQDLIRRSEFHQRESTPTAQSISVAPMDTTLAGIGTEKQFPSNDYDDTIPGISLTPVQESVRYIQPFHQGSSREFAMDVDQTTPHIYSSSPGKSHLKMSTGHRSSGQGKPRAHDTISPRLATGKVSQNSSTRLEALATVAASSQASSDQPIVQSVPPPQLSREPQTKQDQQKQALQKFSKMIARDIRNSSNNDVDLENVVMRVLSSAGGLARKTSTHLSTNESLAQGMSGQPISDGPDADTISSTEALKATQALSKLIKQNGKKPVSANSRSKPFSNNARTCEICQVTLPRACDMKKHMKRHTKPYGCTYPKCHKKFGAKSDWKRHENSQHFQLESFRCQKLVSSSQTPCGELFYRSEMFKKHLQSHHKVTSDGELDHEIKHRRIGRNGQGQFWCGFCRAIIRLKEKRNAAWDERFNHIDEHFSREKRPIEEWLCLEAKKTKGEVKKEWDKDNFDEDGLEEELSPPESQESQEATHPEPELAATASISNPKKRRASDDSQAPKPKRDKREIVRYCCHCQGGPWSAYTYVDCMTCGHHLCDNCTPKVINHGPGELELEVDFVPGGA